jgi:CheY-like chemotaxis protein
MDEPLRVLVADDEPGTRLALQAAIERLGHACTVAADGDEASVPSPSPFALALTSSTMGVAIM